MNIKSAITTEGTPIKIIPYSPEMLTMECGQNAFQDILSNRIQSYYGSYQYVKQHEEFSALTNEIESKAPEFKKAITRIDDIVVSKETECFDAGYRAGMADLMTALTLNDLQIINTEYADMKAMNDRRASDAK
ncbi:MAG: hypothetical protein UU63_C0006G0013 [Candidatus Uhrbacteria bacterium GW2011_GWF2_41_430]|nr:MAG: hypothetical protein UU63_C0006G0013 [Candidatus Uhrbacteria bacterium GW2011_GWF2_41_430]